MNFKKAQPVRIVIADDHPIFRDGLRRLLEAEPDLKVMGEASDGAEAVRSGAAIEARHSCCWIWRCPSIRAWKLCGI
jgi:hypothetical protein